MDRYIIDRIVNDVAVLETEEQTNITVPLFLLPGNVSEGDCLILVEGAYLQDKKASTEREKTINSLIDDLFV